MCVTGKRGTVRCHHPPLLNNGLDGPADSFEPDFLVDSPWVHVGTLNAEPTEITATDGYLDNDTKVVVDARQGITGWTHVASGAIYAAVAPSESRSMVVETKGPDSSDTIAAGRPHI